MRPAERDVAPLSIAVRPRSGQRGQVTRSARSSANCQDAAESRIDGAHGPDEGRKRPSVSLAARAEWGCHRDMRPERSGRSGFLRVDVDGRVSVSKLTHHGVEVADTEVDHPLLTSVTGHVGLPAEDGPYRWSGLLFPDWFVIAARRHINAEVVRIPSPKPVGVRATQEHAADARHPFHRSRLSTQ